MSTKKKVLLAAIGLVLLIGVIIFLSTRSNVQVTSITQIFNAKGVGEITKISVMESTNGKSKTFTKESPDFEKLLHALNDLQLKEREDWTLWTGGQLSVEVVGESTISFMITTKRCSIDDKLYEVTDSTPVKSMIALFESQ